MDIKLDSICKSFGDNRVLRGISINVPSGSAYGLLGRNGAGKTTTIRIIMDVFPADSGTVSVDGRPIRSSDVRIGYLPEERGMYPRKKIRDQLIFFGQLRGMSAKAASKSAEKWLERLEMGEYINKRLDTLSKGNQQKIQLACTLLGDPDIIILDEPFSGLDPVNAQLLKDIVKELVKEGKTVIFSSHQMSYVEEFCDSVAIMRDGAIALEGNLKQIKRGYPRTDILVSYRSTQEASAVLTGLSGDARWNATADAETLTVTLKNEALRAELLETLVKINDGFELFSVKEPSLQDIFISVQKETEAVG